MVVGKPEMADSACALKACNLLLHIVILSPFRIVEAKDSPSGKPLLMASSYDSGTISIFEINGKHI